MRKLAAFIMTTLDGFYEGPDGEFDWPNTDDEFDQFSIENLEQADTLVFGRVTYLGMQDYWTTPEAAVGDPEVARLMNEMPKVVVSTTLTSADWAPSRLIAGDDLAASMNELKAEDGGDLLVLASPNLTGSLAKAGVLDELRLMVCPIALGAGKSLFHAAGDRVPLELLDVRRFASGNLLLTYRPR